MFAKSLIVSFALVAASVQAGLDISTPSELKQCEEATFVISGATGSVWPFVVDPKTPCDDPLRELKDVTGNLKWKADLPVGTNVMVEIEDEAGNQAWSGLLTVIPGSDSSCVPSNSNPSPSSPSSASSAPSAPSAPSALATNPSSTQSYAVSILGGADTPANAANSNTNQTTPAKGAAPARLSAASGVALFTVFSALALAL